MEVKVVKKLNDSASITVTATGDTLEDVLFQAAPIINAPGECPFCRSDDITIHVKIAKKDGKLYKYMSYLCKKCGATQQFGVYMEPKGCFFLKGWAPKYTKQEENYANE